MRRLCSVDASATANQQTRPPALFVFGDSIVDTGNNNALTTLIRCNFPPYGQDFPGHNATGRFSNGRVPSDILGTYATVACSSIRTRRKNLSSSFRAASRLGIKEYVPAYLGTELSDFDLLTGVSFASGGCGFDPLTAELVVANRLFQELRTCKLCILPHF